MLSAMRSISLAVLGGMLLLGSPARSAQPAAAPVMASIKAHPALWIVHSAAGSAYLFGSIHILPPNIDWRSQPVEQALATSAQLAVSLESTGGSPTGQPTGAVVFVAALH